LRTAHVHHQATRQSETTFLAEKRDLAEVPDRVPSPFVFQESDRHQVNNKNSVMVRRNPAAFDSFVTLKYVQDQTYRCPEWEQNSSEDLFFVAGKL
jgi:hypothetical protein